MTPSQPTKDFETAVHGALQLWRKGPEPASPLAHLTLVQKQEAMTGGDLRQATDQVLLDALNALAVDHEPDAAMLRARFLDSRPAMAIAKERHIAEVTLFKMQRQALARLAAVLWRMEEEASADRWSVLKQRFPPASYTTLFGLEAHLSELSEVLQTPQAPWLISVEGLGGIGKTTLAHQLVLRLARHGSTFADFGWVSAQHQTLHLGGNIRPIDEPALTVDVLIAALVAQLLGSESGHVPIAAERALTVLEARLHRTPHLIVVDNLETVADVEMLLPTLVRLAGPSKFLLTSREAFFGQAEIYHFPARELREPDAISLVRAEARLRNLRHVAEASDPELHPLFETVGGNPLALRLVTGQLHLLALSQIVENLREARGKKAEDLYRFIYWDAWQRLPEDARDVLMLMPLFAGDGADLVAISRVSDLPHDSLVLALEHLTKLSLVNIAGDLHSRRYSIHRLTETFLLNEVIKWQGEEVSAP
jgi:hypothetical protein